MGWGGSALSHGCTLDSLGLRLGVGQGGLWDATWSTGTPCDGLLASVGNHVGLPGALAPHYPHPPALCCAGLSGDESSSSSSKLAAPLRDLEGWAAWLGPSCCLPALLSWFLVFGHSWRQAPLHGCCLVPGHDLFLGTPRWEWPGAGATWKVLTTLSGLTLGSLCRILCNSL